MNKPYDLILFDWNGTLSTAEAITQIGEVSPLCDGVAEMLKQFDEAGILMGIVTMASRASMEAQLAEHHIAQHFVVLSCGDDGFVKPHPAAIESALNQTGISPSQTLMVGDAACDMNCARYAGVDGVKIGESLSDNDCIKGVISVVRDLPSWLAQKA